MYLLHSLSLSSGTGRIIVHRRYILLIIELAIITNNKRDQIRLIYIEVLRKIFPL